MAAVSASACVSDFVRIRDELHKAWADATLFAAENLEIPLGQATSPAYEIRHDPIYKSLNKPGLTQKDFEVALQPYPADAYNRIVDLGKEAVTRGTECIKVGASVVDVKMVEKIKNLIEDSVRDVDKEFSTSRGEAAPRAFRSKTAEETEGIFFHDRAGGKRVLFFTGEEAVQVWAGPEGVNGLANAVHNMALDLIKMQGNQLAYCSLESDVRELDQFTTAFCEGNYSRPTITADGRIHSNLGLHKAVMKLRDVGSGKRIVELEYTESGTSTDEYPCSSARLDALRDALKSRFEMKCDMGAHTMTCEGPFDDPAKMKVLGAFLPKLRDLDLYLFCECVPESVERGFQQAQDAAKKPGLVPIGSKLYETETKCFTSKSNAEVYEQKQKKKGSGFDDPGGGDEDEEEPVFDKVQWTINPNDPTSLSCEEVYGYLERIGYLAPNVAKSKIQQCRAHTTQKDSKGKFIRWQATVPRTWETSEKDWSPEDDLTEMESQKKRRGHDLHVDGSPLMEIRVVSENTCFQLYHNQAIGPSEWLKCVETTKGGGEYAMQVTEQDLADLALKAPDLKIGAFPVSPLDAPFSRVRIQPGPAALQACDELIKAGAIDMDGLRVCQDTVKAGKPYTDYINAEEAQTLIEEGEQLLSSGVMKIQAVFMAGEATRPVAKPPKKAAGKKPEGTGMQYVVDVYPLGYNPHTYEGDSWPVDLTCADLEKHNVITKAQFMECSKAINGPPWPGVWHTTVYESQLDAIKKEKPKLQPFIHPMQKTLEKHPSTAAMMVLSANPDDVKTLYRASIRDPHDCGAAPGPWNFTVEECQEAIKDHGEFVYVATSKEVADWASFIEGLIEDGKMILEKMP